MDRAFIIAEAGVNHNGDLGLARQLVIAAAKAGADAVKFQTFRTTKVVTAAAPKAQYQISNTGDAGSQIDMIRALELSDTAFAELAALCAETGIEFMSTPFDLESMAFLTGLPQLRRLKLPSGEITNGRYLLQAARTGFPLILSTGMSSLADIEAALAVLAYGLTYPAGMPAPDDLAGILTRDGIRAKLREKVTLLHCVTEYPAPMAELNLAAMDAMVAAFGLRTGYSDHSLGIIAPVVAVARGACMIEKHLTLDRNASGPDHRASLEPEDFAAMVVAIRDTEAAIGAPWKYPAAAEMKNLPIARRSLVAARPIKRGEVFTAEMLDAKRPGGGMSPMALFGLLGKAASRDYRPDESIVE